MKARYGLIVLLLVGLLVLTILVDRNGSQSHSLQPPTLNATAISQAYPNLPPCSPSQAEFLGPLTPTQAGSQSAPVAAIESTSPTVPVSSWSRRAGFSISTSTDPVWWAGQLGSGWYLDWRVQPPPRSSNLEYWPMVRVHETCISPAVEEIQRVAESSPGMVWIIGNEPDVIWQDNVTPEKYAILYHDLYQLIKAADPTARIAVGGVSQATLLRLEYLDRVLDAYQAQYHTRLPADWWTVHGYVLREEKNSWGVEIPPGIEATQGALREVSDHGRLDLFAAQIRTFRQWMAERGYQDKPLALTEFGILMPVSFGFPPELVAQYLKDTFTYLSNETDQTIGYPLDDYRLVQRWAWFSIADPTYPTSDLGDLATGELTQAGLTFHSIIPEVVP